MVGRGPRGDSKRRGAVVVQFTLALVPILGVVALAIDGGMLFENRRKVQAAADAAALAAAADLLNNYAKNSGKDPSGTAKAAALSNASGNGYANDGSTSVVTVNIPPTVTTNTTFKSKAGYAEVIVQYNQSRGFSGIFGSGTIPVQARAVARGYQTSTSLSAGMLLLDPSGSGALSGSGGGQLLSVKNAGVIVDSSSASAVSVSGSVTLQADNGFAITGSPGVSKSGTATLSGTVTKGATATSDPLATLAAPDPTTMTPRTMPTLGNGVNSATILPGVYTGGISVAQSYTVTMSGGTYYLKGGGFNIQGSATVTGSGVTLYNAPNSTSDQINIANSANVTLSPPTSGTYQGVTIFQARSTTVNPQIVLAGYGKLNLTGTLYAPTATLNVSNGTAGTIIGSQVIAYDASFSGYGQLSINYNSSLVAPGTSTSSYGTVE